MCIECYIHNLRQSFINGGSSTFIKLLLVLVTLFLFLFLFYLFSTNNDGNTRQQNIYVINTIPNGNYDKLVSFNSNNFSEKAEKCKVQSQSSSSWWNFFENEEKPQKYKCKKHRL